MRFDVVTLFAEMFAPLTTCGISRRAHEMGLWQSSFWNPREFSADRHRTVDDRPFGGGPGMVMMAEPLAQAVEAARASQVAAGIAPGPVIAFAANGRALTDRRVRELAQSGGAITLVCGRYEGIDRRFLDAYVDEEVSIGDFVLSGGEVAALALIDAVVRQLPGALKDESVADESFADGLLDAAQYTRPEVWRGRETPAPLLSGHHAQIARWRRERRLAHTARIRPDLIERARREGRLDHNDEKFLRAWSQDRAAGAGEAVPALTSPSSAAASTSAKTA